MLYTLGEEVECYTLNCFMIWLLTDRDGDANFSDVEGGSSGHVESASTGTGLTSLGTSTVYSLIETSHPVFGKVKRLWNSPMESHREVSKLDL